MNGLFSITTQLVMKISSYYITKWLWKKNKKDTQTVCRRLTTNFTELETKYNKISSNKTVQHQQIKTNNFKLVLGEEAQGLESKSGQNS